MESDLDQQEKMENLDFYCLATSYDFLSLKNDVNVPSKRNRHKKFDNFFFCLLEGQ